MEDIMTDATKAIIDATFASADTETITYATSIIYAKDKDAVADFISATKKAEKAKPKLTAEEKKAIREAKKAENMAKTEANRTVVKPGLVVKFRDGNKIDSAVIKDIVKDTLKLDVAGKGYLDRFGKEASIKRLRLSSIVAIVA
jgi:hypothetical protein